MNRQAGMDSVKNETVSYIGQLLVAGSSLMYFKSLQENKKVLMKQQPWMRVVFDKVNLRTSGYVLFFMTVQAVGYQALRAYERGKREYFQRIVGGRQAFSIPQEGAVHLRLMSKPELLDCFTKNKKYISEPHIPVLLDDASAIELEPKLAWNGLLPIDQLLFKSVSQEYDRKQTEMKASPPLYLAESYVGRGLRFPSDRKRLVIIEGQVGSSDSSVHREKNVYEKSSALRDLVKNKFGDKVEVVRVILDWSFSRAIEKKDMSENADDSVVIDGHKLVADEILKWLKERDQIARSSKNVQDRNVQDVESHHDNLIASSGGMEIENSSRNSPVDMASVTAEARSEIDLLDDKIQLVPLSNNAADGTVPQKWEEIEGASTETAHDREGSAVAGVTISHECTMEEDNENDFAEVDYVDDSEEDYYTKAVLSFFEWTGESMRKSGEVLAQNIGKRLNHAHQVLEFFSLSFIDTIKKCRVQLDFSIIPSHSCEDTSDEKIIIITHSSVEEQDNFEIMNLIKNISRKNDVRIVQKNTEYERAHLLNGGESKGEERIIINGKFEEDLVLAKEYAAAGHDVLLLAQDEQDGAEINEINMKVLSLPRVTEEAFVHVSRSLILSFENSHSECTVTSQASRVES